MKCANLQMKLVSSLEKVFPDETPAFYLPEGPVTILSGEWFSFQAAMRWNGDYRVDATVNIVSPIENISWRVVASSPCELAAYPDHDSHYLRTTPGLYPDRLHKPADGMIRLLPGQWRAIWIDIDADGPAGEFPVTVQIVDGAGNVLGEQTLTVKRIGARLPEQKLYFAQWLHTDCIANYYKVPVFSEEYWRIVENFVKTAVRLGINVLLTPLVTPPLDTQIGGERTTVQLLDIAHENGKYTFGFDRLKRWIDMGERCGIKLFEMNHLFTQWGAEHCPKVIACVDGEERQIFGWNDDAAGERYTEFLTALLPALTAKLREWGIADRTVFHLSDEPGEVHLARYKKLRSIVRPLIEGFPIMDALSNYAFYEQGVVDTPICSTNHLEPFLEAGVPGLWAYYCCGQGVDVSNRFFAMSSARNRIIGVQMYKFHIVGFLQWGYNFYSSDLSRYPIDPYSVTDGCGAFPAGDPFSVYPGVNGGPEESLRAVVFCHAIQDMRALELLESLSDREHVMRIMEDGLTSPITFKEYPHSADYILDLRERVNREIERLTKAK